MESLRIIYAMEGKTRPISCIPCSKRKVRCDHEKPCSHCKRRKGDICVYPNGATRTSEASVRLDTARSSDAEIRPEARTTVRAEGVYGTSSLPYQMGPASPARPDIAHTAERDAPISGSGTKRRYDGTPINGKTESQAYPQAGLVELNNQSTYIDSEISLLARTIRLRLMQHSASMV